MEFDALIKKNLRYLYLAVLLVGIYQILFAKDIITGIPLMVIAGILLSLKQEEVKNTDDRKVIWDDFADSPIGKVLVMGRHFEDFFKIDELASNPDEGTYFLDMMIKTWGNIVSYEAPSNTTSPAIYFLRADTSPLKDGGARRSRFINYVSPTWGDKTSHSDILWTMENIIKSETKDDPKEILNKFRQYWGIKKSRRVRRATEQNALASGVGAL